MAAESDTPLRTRCANAIAFEALLDGVLPGADQ